MSGPPPAGGPPPVAILMDAATAKFKTAALGVIARRKVADHVADEGSSAADIAKATNLNADALHRVMRFLTASGIFVELPDKKFKHSPASEMLKSSEPNNMLGMAIWMSADFHNNAYNELEHSVATGEECWSKAHGGKNIWQYAASEPRFDPIFQGAMTTFSHPTAMAICAGVDFDKFAAGKTICDLGGGFGYLLASVLRRAGGEGLKGILFELPNVAAATDKIKESTGDQFGNIAVIGGDIMKEVPKNVDVFMMKHIIHDHSDERCKVFLSHCAKNINKGGRIFVFEHLLQGPNVMPDPAKTLDIEMLACTEGGRERSVEDFQKLFAESGLKFVKVHPLQGPVQAIEAEVA